MTETGDRVAVTAETTAGPVELEASWLVGADGGRSGVHGALGLGFDG